MAQEFSVTPQTQKPAQTQSAAKPTQTPQLGFGSNIENARLARAAELALQQGNKAEALEYARRAAQGAPSNPQLWFLVGYAARLNGRPGESVEAYNRGLKLMPGSADGRSGLAQTYSTEGRNDEAIKILKEVVAADGSRRGDILLLGELLMRSGDYQGAIDWLIKGERMKPEVRPELLLAISYQRLKQMDEANHYLELAEKRAPDNPEVRRSMAGYFRDTAAYDKAIAQLKGIPNPKPDVLAELAYTYQLAGNMTESANIYTKAANAMPKDLTLQLSAAQAQIGAGAVEKAEPFIDRAASIDPSHYRLHAIKGLVAKIQENDPEALKQYQAAVTALPKEPSEGPLYGIQLHLNLMDVYKDLADDANAKRELDTAQSQINAMPEPTAGKNGYLRLRAVIKLAAADPNGALADMKEALATNPNDRDDLQLNGDILMKIGRTEDAITSYKKVLGDDPNNRSALTSLGYASRVAGRDQDAEIYFQKLAEIDPKFYVPYLALGDLYTARHDYPKAQESYEKAFALTQKRPMVQAGGLNAAIEAHDMKAGALWESRVTPEMKMDPQILRESERFLSFNKDYEGSAEQGRLALKVLPHDRDVVVYLGYDLLNLGKYDELLALTQAQMDAFPKEADLPLLQGYVYKHMNQNEAAVASFTEALKRDPEMVTGYVNRGYTLNDLHKQRAAAEDFEAAIKRDPNNAEAHLGLAFSDLSLHRSQAAIRQTELTEKITGDSKELHLIRATAYGQESMLKKAGEEYRAALKFDPNDGSIHLGLGNVIFSERHYHEAIEELQIAAKLSPDIPEIYALMARAYAYLGDRDNALANVKLAEDKAEHPAPVQQAANVSPTTNTLPSVQEPRFDVSQIYISTGQALNTLGDRDGAMVRFSKALDQSHGDRVGVRMAIAQLMAEKGQAEDAERQIALAQMEGVAGEAEPPTGNQYIAAADVFRALHEYELSEQYLDRAKAAGAPDAQVRLGRANTYLAVGDTKRAEAELAAVKAEMDEVPEYQFLLAQANVYRQEHRGDEALTSFAQASTLEGEDPTAQQGLLQAGADEGLRVTHYLSLLADASVEPIFEDSTVYALDTQADSIALYGGTQQATPRPPRSSIEWQETDAYHLHVENWPTIAGFFQVRNARGQVSAPAFTGTGVGTPIVNRDTTDYAFNVGVNPTIHAGRNVFQIDAGVQEIIRRDSGSLPSALNQNLFRQFFYLSTSSFFNKISGSGYFIHESGPFIETRNNTSSSLIGAFDLRVGAPWGKTALVTGWGENDQKFLPQKFENYFTASYVGMDRKFGEKLDVKAVINYVRAWRVINGFGAIAQNLHPAANVDFAPNKQWDIQIASSYSNLRNIQGPGVQALSDYHIYDSVQNGVSVTYARPFKRKFNDESGDLMLQYPIRFTGGVQDESFFNFSGPHSQQLRPYFRISLF